MIALVQRVPGDDNTAVVEFGAALIDAGAHFTFLQDGGTDAPVAKAAGDHCKLTLGQLRHGGVWLSPFEQIGTQLAVAEGIETALSVMQITKLPTVAALSAAGMRSMRWPPQVRRLWIAADNDEAGLKAAEVLLGRALRAGLQAHIKVPARADPITACWAGLVVRTESRDLAQPMVGMPSHKPTWLARPIPRG